MNFDYPKICQSLVDGLPERNKKVLLRRFGLEQNSRPETLESIGRDFGITRERVRQIQKDSILKIAPKLKKYQNIVSHFVSNLKTTGGLRKEEILLSHLGGENHQSHVSFLLTLAKPFKRFAENEELYAFWTLNGTLIETAKKIIKSCRERLNKVNKPLKLADFKSGTGASKNFVEYFLELSKIIQKNQEGFFGLRHWPEINPRYIKDKAYLALKKAAQPLHFRDVAQNIGPETLVQTVHNELIRDPRFVLVGRGIYALKEWGFRDGDVKDIIYETLKKRGPLSKKEILNMVLEQRLVKKNTILLNLENKRYFLRTPEGKYLIKEV